MARRLGGFDSWLIGVAAMLGAGVFVVFGPAFGLAGGWLWFAVLLAGVIAALNATSVAWLAQRFPLSGAGYRYSTEVLGPTAGFTTGLAFLVGKSASVAAAALVIAGSVSTIATGWFAVGVISVSVLLNYFGITATARGVRYLAFPSLVVLIALLAALQIAAPATQTTEVSTGSAPDIAGIFTATGLLFFAFAGYARIATLAGEVNKPASNVPRAMLAALGAVLVVYLGFALALPATLGAGLATSDNAVLAAATQLGEPWPTLVRTILLLAAGAALLVLLAGLGRTAEVMAGDGELPKHLTRKSRFGSPWLAEGLFGGLAALIALAGQVVFAISVSAVLVLIYYGFAHLAVLRRSQNWLPRLVAAPGLLLCLTAALSLEAHTVALAIAMLIVAVTFRAAIAKMRRVD